MQYIYFSTVGGDMVDNYELVRMAKVVYDINIYPTDFVEIRKFANQCEGICQEINPSVKHLIKNGRKYKALMVYHRKHPEISLNDCKKIMDEIEENLNRNKEN
jgi:hypothetical protein